MSGPLVDEMMRKRATTPSSADRDRPVQRVMTLLATIVVVGDQAEKRTDSGAD
jgi:hypothetical protein